MKSYTLFSGLFILSFFILAIGLSGASIVEASSKTQRPDLKKALNGEWAQIYEAAFDQNLPIYEIAKNFWGKLTYALFTEGKSGVLIGADGWLFTTEEFEHSLNAEKRIEENITYISEVHKSLKSQNIDLLIVPVPAKARIYQNKLGAYRYPIHKKPVYQIFKNVLQDRSIAFVDVLGVMAQNKASKTLFLRADTHWTPEGAEITAQQVAEDVGRLYPDLNLQTTTFETRRDGNQKYDGDLLRYVPGLGDLEVIEIVQTKKTEHSVQTADASGALAFALFGEESLPVTLVGTSYSANPLWNFEGFLKEALGVDVLNAADEGLGPFETMQKYLDNGVFRSNPPQLIIWEIPERYLSFAYDLDMPPI